MSTVAPMRPEQMKPFIDGTVEVFQSLLRIRLKESAVEFKNAAEGTIDLSAVIGLTGAATGSFVLSAPCETAQPTMSLLMEGARRLATETLIPATSARPGGHPRPRTPVTYLETRKQISSSGVRT